MKLRNGYLSEDGIDIVPICTLSDGSTWEPVTGVRVEFLYRGAYNCLVEGNHDEAVNGIVDTVDLDELLALWYKHKGISDK